MAKLNFFSSHYSTLPCHMILQNHSNMLIWCSRIGAHFILLSVLETVVLLNIFVETVIYFFQDTFMNRIFQKNIIFETVIFITMCKCLLSLLF